MSEFLNFGLSVLGSSLVVTALLALLMRSLIKTGSGTEPHEASQAPVATSNLQASTAVTSDRATPLYSTASADVSDAYGLPATRVSGVYGTAREKLVRGTETIAEVAARQKEQIAAAIEAGKQAYREEKRKAGAARKGEEA